VQYFERAVFEAHPENAPPYDVLLSQLGTFRYQQKQGQVTPTVVAVDATPTPKPAAPTATPKPTGPDCSGIPDPKDATITPNCGPIGTVFNITAHGFTPNEQLSFWLTMPDGEVLGTPRPVDIGGHSGSFRDRLDSSALDVLGSQAYGIWAITYEGAKSHHQSIVWFKITPPAGSTPTPTAGPAAACDVSGDKDGESTPSSGKPGDTLRFTARGFTPGEPVSFWFTLPDQSVFGTSQPVPGRFVNADGTIGPLPFTIEDADVQAGEGRWAVTFEGARSHHQSIIYFCIHR